MRLPQLRRTDCCHSVDGYLHVHCVPAVGTDCGVSEEEDEEEEDAHSLTGDEDGAASEDAGHNRTEQVAVSPQDGAVDDESLRSEALLRYRCREGKAGNGCLPAGVAPFAAAAAVLAPRRGARAVSRVTSIEIVSVVMQFESQENEEEIVTGAKKVALGGADAAAPIAAADVDCFALSEAVDAVADCAETCGIRERPSLLFLLLSFCRAPSNIQHLGVVLRTFVSVSRYLPRFHRQWRFSLLDSKPYRSELISPG